MAADFTVMEHALLTVWLLAWQAAMFCARLALQLWCVCLFTGIVALTLRSALNAWRRKAGRLPPDASMLPACAEVLRE